MKLRIIPCPVSPVHRLAWEAHFLRLEPEGLSRRFGGFIKPPSIKAYVERARPTVMVVLQDKGLWRGVAEVHPLGDGHAEGGLSLEWAYRGQGWGQRLMDLACIEAKRSGLSEVRLVMSSHNPAIVSLSQKMGATLNRQQDMLIGSMVL